MRVVPALYHDRLKIVIVLLAILTFGLGIAIASARPRMSLQALPLVIEGASGSIGMRKLASLGSYLRALHRAKQICDFSPYAYGANLSCRTTAGKMVYIDIAAVPTYGPEFASVQEIRPDGVNSAYLPKSEFAGFLADLIKVQAAN